jgi:hypothetical protein
MQIYAMIAGLHESDFPVDTEPHETIATLFAKMKKELLSMELPHEFTAAYSIIHTRKEGLLVHDPDNLSLEEGDPNIMVNYLTPAARLDPNKTVQHYFGTRVKPEAASIVLTLPTQSLAQQKKKNPELEEKASPTDVEQANRSVPVGPMGQTIERDEGAAGAAVPVAVGWHSLAMGSIVSAHLETA